MNDNGVDELERQIADRLHGHSRLAPDTDGWEGILDRIEHRGRARHRRRAAATGLVVVGMVGSLIVLTGDNDATRVSTTPAGPATPALTTPTGSLPRLVLDVPGLELRHASSTEDVAPFPDLGPILVYGFPGEGLVGPGPVLFVRLVPAGARYGIGDGPEVREVDVAGRPGRLISTGDPNVSLGWPREDGSIVHLQATGLVEGDVVVAAQILAEALGHAPPTSLPGGLVLLRETAADTSASTQTEVDYESGTRSVGLRLLGGGTYRLDDLVLDRLNSSAHWRSATVDGAPAVLSYYPSPDALGTRVTLMWAIADGVVAELTAQGLSDAEIDAAASSIRAIDEATWQGLLAESDAQAAIPVPGQAELDTLHSGLTSEMCQARNAWLKARTAGDGAVEAASVANLEAMLAEGEADGLGSTGDILVVAQRLLDAMAAGDDALVSSIPEGGACS